VDIAGGDHGATALVPGSVLDPAEDSALALAERVADSGVHSKASCVWESEVM
jgi:hypothetical protein